MPFSKPAPPARPPRSRPKPAISHAPPHTRQGPVPRRTPSPGNIVRSPRKNHAPAPCSDDSAPPPLSPRVGSVARIPVAPPIPRSGFSPPHSAKDSLARPHTQPPCLLPRSSGPIDNRPAPSRISPERSLEKSKLSPHPLSAPGASEANHHLHAADLLHIHQPYPQLI